MATTVNGAFAEFLREHVNLDPAQTKKARASRDWLRGQLALLHDKHDDFPVPYTEKHVSFGSFARHTKKRPLDDIDLIHCLSGEGGTYLDVGSHITISVPTSSRLSSFCYDDSTQLNSTRVINKFRKHLNEIPNYADDAASRDGQAAVLELASYTWNFDIVPGFFTAPELDGRTYYVIPDGKGNWMKTDPRRDGDWVTEVNQRHGGKVLNVVRLMKYWNARPTMPSVPSYTFEALLVRYYENKWGEASEFVDLELPDLLAHVASAIVGAVQDPKGIQGDINTLSYTDRLKVSARARQDAERARSARDLENKGDQKGSIQKWGEIFGPSFPNYTGTAKQAAFGA